MNCTQCGRDVPSGSAFCPQCGAQLTAGADRTATASGAQRMKAANRSAATQPGETELWSGTYSPKAMVGPAVGAAIVTILGLVAASFAGPAGWIAAAIGAVLIWAALGLVLLYRRLTVRYRLTTYRFFHETGLLSRTRNRVEVIDINDVTLQQGIIERMFEVGTIHIQSSDVTHPDLYLAGIENVRQVTDLIDNTRRAERQRRGVFMENIGPQTPGSGTFAAR